MGRQKKLKKGQITFSNFIILKKFILKKIVRKRLLTLDEQSIAIGYIALESWGNPGDNPGRRQDWTAPITISQIARECGIPRGNCSRILRKLMKDNIIFAKGEGLMKQYQFNEHIERWCREFKAPVSKRTPYQKDTPPVSKRTPYQKRHKDVLKKYGDTLYIEKKVLYKENSFKKWMGISGRLHIHTYKALTKNENEWIDEIINLGSYNDFMKAMDNFEQLMQEKREAEKKGEDIHPYFPKITTFSGFIKDKFGNYRWQDFFNIKEARRVFNEKGYKKVEGEKRQRKVEEERRQEDIARKEEQVRRLFGKEVVDRNGRKGLVFYDRVIFRKKDGEEETVPAIKIIDELKVIGDAKRF